MKKFKFVFLFLIFAFISSCKQNVDLAENEPTETELSTQTREEALLSLMERGSYYLEEEEIKDSLTSMVQELEGDISVARMATNNIEVEKVMEMPLKSGELNLFSDNEGITNLEEEDASSNEQTKFFIYNVKKNEKKGFAITCNDLRIGRVLAFIEEGEFKCDISDNPFLQLIASRIESYVEDTNRKWKELKEMHPTLRSIYEGHRHKDAYKYENWKKLNIGGSPLLTTAWHQNAPFNEVVTAVEGYPCVTGCSYVALAQVFAYHKHFRRYWYKDDYNSYVNAIKNKVKGLRNWDGSFDWDEITNAKYKLSDDDYKDESKFPKNVSLQIGALMSIIGRMGSSEYSHLNSDEGTTMTSRNLAKCCKWFGYWQYSPWGRSYSYIGFRDYNFEDLKHSIDEGFPVILRGDSKEIVTSYRFLWWTWNRYSYEDGHAWVVDGYAKLKCKATNNATGKKSIMTEDYVHCNPGWGNRYNGYYINNLFAFGKGPIAKDNNIHSMSTNGEDNYYRYNVKMLDHLKPYHY